VLGIYLLYRLGCRLDNYRLRRGLSYRLLIYRLLVNRLNGLGCRLLDRSRKRTSAT
jgi:hypothetical protein